MVDLALTKEESDEASPVPATASDRPMYPWGLRINLCQDELEKLGLSDDDIKPGDMIHFHSMATVVSVSTNQTQDGDDHCSVALQITHMNAVENESDEDEEAEKEMNSKGLLKKLYM